MTELYIRLYLSQLFVFLRSSDCNVVCFPCESNAEAAEWMMKIVDCVRNAPYTSESQVFVKCSPPLSELSVITRGRALGSVNQNDPRCVNKETVLYRMLQCISGVSSAKASSVVSHYHSVYELLAAYEAAETEEEKERLLSVENKGKL